jgi:Protein of unknown function (DUF2905)
VREPGTVRWLVVSVALSVVLTVLVNIWLRAFPDAGRSVARTIAERTSSNVGDVRAHDRRVRVFVPWKAMIVGSLLLTVVVNLVLWIR